MSFPVSAFSYKRPVTAAVKLKRSNSSTCISISDIFDAYFFRFLLDREKYLTSWLLYVQDISLDINGAKVLVLELPGDGDLFFSKFNIFGQSEIYWFVALSVVFRLYLFHIRFMITLYFVHESHLCELVYLTVNPVPPDNRSSLKANNLLPTGANSFHVEYTFFRRAVQSIMIKLPPLKVYHVTPWDVNQKEGASFLKSTIPSSDANAPFKIMPDMDPTKHRLHQGSVQY